MHKMVHKTQEMIKLDAQRLQEFIQEWGVNVNNKGSKVREPCQFFVNKYQRIEDVIKFVTQERSEKQPEETVMTRKWLTEMNFAKMIGKEFNQNEIKEISKEIRYCFRRKGQKLLQAGLKDDRLYFILRGKVKFMIPQN